MNASPITPKTYLKLTTVAIAVMLTGWAALFPAGVDSASGSADPEATPTPRKVIRAGNTPARSKYSDFDHSNKAHAKLDCASCHKFPSENWNKVRTGDAAFPDITEYPKHASCLNCHKQQFFRGSTPAICTICHTNPGPRNSLRHPFPNPREIFDPSPKGRTSPPSDFEVAFPHDKHIEIVSRFRRAEPMIVNAGWASSRRRLAEESCAVCHKTMSPQGDSADEYLIKPPADLGDVFWLKKGTFKSSPLGHTTCFTCHSVDSGLPPAPTDCATCHKPRQTAVGDFDPALAARIGLTDRAMLEAWRTRFSAGTFRHEFPSHSDMSCATCHTVTSMVTNDQITKKVPISSCNMCHITATSDDGGVLNLEIDSRKKDPKFTCVKCHVAFGSREIPQSHYDAVKAAGQ